MKKTTPEGVPAPGEGGSEWVRVRNLCGAVGTVFAGMFEVFVSAETVLLRISYSADSNVSPGSPIQPEPAILTAPRSLFADDAQIAAWAQGVYENVLRLWHVVLVTETDLHFRDAALVVANHMGLVSAGPEAIIKEHLKAVGRRLRDRFNLPPPAERGQKSPWTAGDLIMALQAIVNELDVPATRLTWELIHEKLKVRFPKKAPKSPESLRKLAGTFGHTLTDLRRIRREQRARVAQVGK